MSVQFPLNPDSLPMGANVTLAGTGVTFRVRAPRPVKLAAISSAWHSPNYASARLIAAIRILKRRAQNVWVRGTFNNWVVDDASLLHRHGEYWVGYIDGVREGARYKFYVEGQLSTP